MSTTLDAYVFIPTLIPSRRGKLSEDLVAVAGGCQIAWGGSLVQLPGHARRAVAQVTVPRASAAAFYAVLHDLANAIRDVVRLRVDGADFDIGPDPEPPTPGPSRARVLFVPTFVGAAASVVVPLRRDPVTSDGAFHGRATYQQVFALARTIACGPLFWWPRFEGFWLGGNDPCGRLDFALARSDEAFDQFLSELRGPRLLAQQQMYARLRGVRWQGPGSGIPEGPDLEDAT